MAHHQDTALHASLATLGFVREDGGSAYRRGDFACVAGQRWATLTTHRTGLDAAAAPVRGGAGLWKPVGRGDDATMRFDIFMASPAGDAGSADLDDADRGGMIRMQLEWALATAAGSAPQGWSPPPLAEVNELIPQARLTLQAGPHVRQGSIALESSRLAVMIPILPRIPDELSAARRQWLEILLDDANRRWRIVRVAFKDGDRAALEAVVDLSGCPAGLMPLLLPMCVDALRHVAEWLLPSAVLTADAHRGFRLSEVLDEVDPHQKENGHG